jgi:hypothetical protein
MFAFISIPFPQVFLSRHDEIFLEKAETNFETEAKSR